MYDFFYMPQDRRRKSNLGYAFINFTAPSAASDFQARMQGRSLAMDGKSMNSQKICEVTVATIQGLERNLEHFQKCVKRNPDTSLYMSDPSKIQGLEQKYKQGQKAPVGQDLNSFLHEHQGPEQNLEHGQTTFATQ